MSKTITRIYSDYASADRAVLGLREAGLSERNISILASNTEGWYKPGDSAVDPAHDKDRDGHDDRAEGAAAGGGIGVIAGGAAGTAAGLGLLAIPGVGPIVAAGWLAALAAGAAAGGVAGGLIGALVESGTSKENAELYAEALRRGGAIVTARVDEADEARYAAIMDASAVPVNVLILRYRESGWEGYNPSAPVYNAEEARREREANRL